MCNRCEDIFTDAAEALDELVLARMDTREDTPTGNTVRTALTVLRCIYDDDARGDRHVQQVCFALATAVERLAALEKSGIPT